MRACWPTEFRRIPIELQIVAPGLKVLNGSFFCLIGLTSQLPTIHPRTHWACGTALDPGLELMVRSEFSRAKTSHFGAADGRRSDLAGCGHPVSVDRLPTCCHA